MICLRNSCGFSSKGFGNCACATSWNRLAKASSIGLEDSDLTPPLTLAQEISLSVLKVKTSI